MHQGRLRGGRASLRDRRRETGRTGIEGGLDAAAKERLRKNIANGRAQLAGNMPREGRFTTPTILSGAALQMNFAPDGSMIGEPTVVRAPPPTRAEDE